MKIHSLAIVSLALLLLMLVLRQSAVEAAPPGSGVVGRLFKKTALHRAAMKSNVEKLINLLLAGKVDVNEKDFYGRTALHYAAQSGCENCAIYLVLKGASIEEMDNEGRTALVLANKYKRKAVAKFLTSAQNRNAKQWEGVCEKYDPLQLQLPRAFRRAVEKGKSKSNNKLLYVRSYEYLDHTKKDGVKVVRGENQEREPTYYYDEPPHYSNVLHQAAQAGDATCVLFQLLFHVEIVDSVDFTGFTALHYAAEKGRDECVLLLLMSDAYAHKEDNVLGRTPLHYAAENGHKTSATYLRCYRGTPIQEGLAAKYREGSRH